MTETPTTDSTDELDASPTDQPGSTPATRSDPEPPAADASDDRTDGAFASSADVQTYLLWAALVVLSLLALYALVRFYGSASSAIGLWVEPEFEPIVQAAFNLVVLLLAAVGISVVVRRLS